MTTWYESGPMTNIEAFNFPMFDDVKLALPVGDTVFSPADHDREVIDSLWPGKRPQDFEGYTTGDITKYFDAVSDGGRFTLDNMMRWDITTILTVDRIVMLPNWEKSTGARIERLVAESVGIEVWLADWAIDHWYFAADADQKRCSDALKEGVRLLEVTSWGEYDQGDASWRRRRLPEIKGSLQPTPTPVIEQPLEAWRSPIIPPHAGELSDWERLQRNAHLTADLGVVDPERLAEAGWTPDMSNVNPGTVTYVLQSPGQPLAGAGGNGGSGEVRVTDPVTGGQKGRKLARWDLLPPDALLALAEHYGLGATKYEDRNWEKGYTWGLSLSSLQNHLKAWEMGEEVDAEGFRHIVAVAWHALTLLTFSLRGIGTDDRPSIGGRNELILPPREDYP